jgi:iron complex outermembrane recepter protein
MTKKIFLLVSFLYFVAAKTFAQNGTISGSVRTSDGDPVELVTVNVKGTAKGALTDRNGKYLIKNIQPGLHRLIATFIGLEKQEQTVEVAAGSNVVADFNLKENSAQLQEVVVSGRNQKPEPREYDCGQNPIEKARKSAGVQHGFVGDYEATGHYKL